MVLYKTLIIIIASLLVHAASCSADPMDQTEGVGFRRIISLSPSTTEILFALGLGDRVCGVTRFCTFPPEARDKTGVGGYLDPNYEVIAVLKADVVIILPEQRAVEKYLQELGIEYFIVDNKRIEDILSAIILIGSTCGAENIAIEMVASLRSRIESVRSRAEGAGKPKTLISIGRDFGTGSLGKVYVAGKNTYFDELLEIAGGANACSSNMVRYPAISAEGILSIDPDVVIELIPDLESTGLNAEEIRMEWNDVMAIRAIRNSRFHLLAKGYSQIPGPRFILLLEDLAEILHPEKS